MKTTTESWAQKYLQFALNNRYKLLFLSILLFTGSLFYISQNLKLNNNLSALLPQNTPSIIALKESNKRFGSTDKFMIAIQAKSPILLAKLQDSIKAKIEREWKEETIYVQIERDNSFFQEKALLYLPVHHLERVRDNLETIQSRMGKAFNPLVATIDVEDTEEEELVWFDANIPQELGLPDEAASAFTAFIEPSEEEQKSDKKEFDPKAVIPEHLRTRTMGQHQDGSINAIVVVKLGEPSTNLNFTKHILSKADKLITEVKASFKIAPGDPIYLTVEGTYEGLKDIEDMAWDGIISGIISLALILFLLIYFFRSFLAAIILLSQVLFACTLMLLFTTIFYGQLNPFTLFVSAIILGMGIDFSIHFMGSAQRYQKECGSMFEGLIKTIEHISKPMALAAGTTIAGLLTLLFAEFAGFYEFGVIASMGILFSLGSSILGIPVLFLISQDIKNKLETKQSTFSKVFAGIAVLGVASIAFLLFLNPEENILLCLYCLLGVFFFWLLKSVAFGIPHKKDKSLFPASWSESYISSLLGKTVVVFVVVSLLLIAFAPYADFEHNFRKLRADRKQAKVVKDKPNMHVGVAISSNRKSSQPAAVMGDNAKELEILHDSLLHRLHESKDPYLRSFLTLSTFVPPENRQEERMEIIEEIRDLIHSKAFEKVDGENKEQLDKLKELSDVEAFTAEDIPRWALNLLKEKDGTYGTIGFVYGKFESWNALDVAKFQDKYDSWNFGGKDLRVFSSSFIFSDIIKVVKSDSFKMAIIISFVLLLTLALSLRNKALIIISAVSLFGGILWTVGLMGLTTKLVDLGKVGIYNVIVIPTVLGVGIDSTIHLLMAYFSSSKKSLRELYDHTGSMVVASSLTTAAGFVGVLFISHKGMRTIGELAVLGIFATLMVSLIVVPYLSQRFVKSKEG